MKKFAFFFATSSVFLIPILFYFSKFQGPFSSEHTRWGEFGSYLSGVYGSLALVIVAYTTYISQAQFKRQNEDGVFFKLFDSLQNRVVNSVIRVDDENLSAQQCLKHIATRFSDELYIEAVDIARMLLIKSPEIIGVTQYAKLFSALNGEDFWATFEEDQTTFIKKVTSSDDSNVRWEVVKEYIGSRGFEGEEIREALRAIGSVYFYKIPFQERQYHYKHALSRIISAHGELLDGYFSSLYFMLQLAENASNRDVYVQYLQAQLTRYEVIIVFYMLAGQQIPHTSTVVFQKSGILNRLKTYDCLSLMIDAPSPEDIEHELRGIFSK